jgi:hypothetical protein
MGRSGVDFAGLGGKGLAFMIIDHTWKPVRRACMGWAVFVLVAAVLQTQTRAAPKPARPKPPEPPPAAPAVAAPADLNELSLRLIAMETLYELDLSPAQLAALRTGAAACGQVKTRAAAKGTPKLAAAMKDLYAAMAGQDHEKVGQLREQVADLSDDEAVDLDDEVTTTDAARGRAPQVLKLLKAGQVAAYLADHADELADPAELLIDALAEIREPDADDPDGEIHDTAEMVGILVAGMDAAKAKAVSDEATAWLKAGKELAADAYAARHEALVQSAHKIAGDVPPMVVLTHWMENELAELLSNPQLTGAIDALAAGKK